MKRTYADMNDMPAGSPLAGEHTPKISRKIRACKECQSRKVKCDLPDGTNTCARCRRLGLKCVINKSLQTLLDDENEWKNDMEAKYQQMQTAIQEILRQQDLPPLESFTPNGQRAHVSTPSMTKSGPNAAPASGKTMSAAGPTPPQSEYFSPTSRQSVPGMSTTRDNSPEPHDKDNGENQAHLCSGTMASLFEVTRLKNLGGTVSERPDGPHRNPMFDDIISQGKVGESEAEDLFNTFNTTINHFLWGGIALKHDSLQSLRESSSLLLTSILAVTALHSPDAEQTLDLCYSELLSLISRSMFDHHHCLDDVRALCIGAFYLSEVSWKLSGHAIRIATEMHLHQAFSKALAGSMEHIERARVWYLLYICDHHFSLAYNRPPVIHEDESIRNHEKFLQLPGITNADFRLLSQVGVFKILSRVFSDFGHDSDKPVLDEDLAALRQYNADLDMWKTTWESRLAPNPHIQTYPAKGCTLHSSFAKLQVNCLCLRGITSLSVHDPRRAFINEAVENATTCLSFVLDEPDIRNAIVGVPLYLSTTITYSSVFLMKAHLNWPSAQLNTNFGLIVELIERIIRLLGETRASDRHVAIHTARGLSQMLRKFKEREAKESRRNGTVNMQSMSPVEPVPMDYPVRWQQPMDLTNTQSWAGSSLDWFGLDDHYMPSGVFDAAASSLPVVGWPLNSPPPGEPLKPQLPSQVTSWPMSATPMTSNPSYMGLQSWTTDASPSCLTSATPTPVSTASWLAENPNQSAWVED